MGWWSRSKCPATVSISPQEPAAKAKSYPVRLTFSYDQLAALERALEREEEASREHGKIEEIECKARHAVSGLTSAIEQYMSDELAGYKSRGEIRPIRDRITRWLLESMKEIVHEYEAATVAGWTGTWADKPWDLMQDETIRWLRTVVTSLRATKGAVTMEVPENAGTYIDYMLAKLV